MLKSVNLFTSLPISFYKNRVKVLTTEVKFWNQLSGLLQFTFYVFYVTASSLKVLVLLSFFAQFFLFCITYSCKRIKPKTIREIKSLPSTLSCTRTSKPYQSAMLHCSNFFYCTYLKLLP